MITLAAAVPSSQLFGLHGHRHLGFSVGVSPKCRHPHPRYARAYSTGRLGLFTLAHRYIGLSDSMLYLLNIP